MFVTRSQHMTMGNVPLDTIDKPKLNREEVLVHLDCKRLSELFTNYSTQSGPYQIH